MNTLTEIQVTPDWQSFVRCIRRERTPQRVHTIELFLDPEVQTAVADRFGLLEGLDPGSPEYHLQRSIRIQRFLGYDYVRCGLDNVAWRFNRHTTADTASLKRQSGRSFVDLHAGPITSWEEFDRYPWPEPSQWQTRSLEWLGRNLPDDMCIEDVIENVVESKRRFGDRIALLGGIDVDFLCRADETAVRQRVRRTLDQCMPGGGYCLGTGNSVANYIPLDNYLVMLDEGRRYR